MNQKKKWMLLKSSLLAISIGVAHPPLEVQASEYPDWFTKLIDFSEKTEEKINEKIVNPIISTTDQVRNYELSDLWLISDQPAISLDKERHFYFVNKESLGVIEWNYYYDETGRTTKDVARAVQKENRQSYFSISDPNTFFVPSTFIDLTTGEVSTNYQEWDEASFVYDSTTAKKYIVYTDISSIIPEKYLHVAYLNDDQLSIMEIKAIENELNDMNTILRASEVNFELENAKKEKAELQLKRQRLVK